MVVNHYLDHRNIMACRGSDLIHIHTETSVTCNIDNGLFRSSDLGSK